MNGLRITQIEIRWPFLCHKIISQFKKDNKQIIVLTLKFTNVIQLRGCSQIMSAAKGGVGGWKMLTMADEGGRGG